MCSIHLHPTQLTRLEHQLRASMAERERLRSAARQIAINLQQHQDAIRMLQAWQEQQAQAQAAAVPAAAADVDARTAGRGGGAARADSGSLRRASTHHDSAASSPRTAAPAPPAPTGFTVSPFDVLGDVPLDATTEAAPPTPSLGTALGSSRPAKRGGLLSAFLAGRSSSMASSPAAGDGQVRVRMC